MEVVAEGPRGRRDHAVTARGRDALRTWLLAPRDGAGTVRNEFVLRLFLLSVLEPADARAVLAGVEQHVAAEIAEIEEAQRDLRAAGHPADYGPNVAAELGLRTNRATLGWARWAGEQLAQRH